MFFESRLYVRDILRRSRSWWRHDGFKKFRYNCLRRDFLRYDVSSSNLRILFCNIFQWLMNLLRDQIDDTRWRYSFYVLIRKMLQLFRRIVIYRGLTSLPKRHSSLWTKKKNSCVPRADVSFISISWRFLIRVFFTFSSHFTLIFLDLWTFDGTTISFWIFFWSYASCF